MEDGREYNLPLAHSRVQGLDLSNKPRLSFLQSYYRSKRWRSPAYVTTMNEVAQRWLFIQKVLTSMSIQIACMHVCISTSLICYQSPRNSISSYTAVGTA